jgi:hypothetical protein
MFRCTRCTFSLKPLHDIRESRPRDHLAFMKDVVKRSHPDIVVLDDMITYIPVSHEILPQNELYS